MGAPKLKWTAEEEAALKAGISRYGLGKWSTILKDAEFSIVLRSRSNVDLKDKWRNLSCMANGLGSRQRSRVPVRINPPPPKHDEETSVNVENNNDSQVLDVPTNVAMEIDQPAEPKKEIPRLDDVVLEAIRKLKEPRGSSRTSIVQYIGEHYSAPPDLEKNLVSNLKALTENGLLVKVKSQYRIAPKLTSFAAEKEPNVLLTNEKLKGTSTAAQNNHTGQNGFICLTKAQVDEELERMKYMTAEEAAAAAAQAVAEAEAAIAEAEAAAKEAEAAEAEAEEARCFAAATQKSMHFPTIRV